MLYALGRVGLTQHYYNCLDEPNSFYYNIQSPWNWMSPIIINEKENHWKAIHPVTLNYWYILVENQKNGRFLAT